MKSIGCIFSLSLLVAVLGSSAQAQQRTFISGLGNDANPCSRTAPCRTFGQAISQTNPGGEVIVLDSAGYGAVTITKSVSLISPPGVYAGISVFFGDGIDINAGFTDVIILRGLTINNQGSSGDGILFSTGGTLHVENCVVNGFTSNVGFGIAFFGPGKLEVKDSIMRGNSQGIFVGSPSGTTALASIDNTRLETNSSFGLQVGGGSSATIRGSVISNNHSGIAVFSSTSKNGDLDVESCVVSNNSSDGISSNSLSGGVATVRVSNSTVTGNNIGLDNVGSPARILSRGNNTVERNITDTMGSIGFYPAK